MRHLIQNFRILLFTTLILLSNYDLTNAQSLTWKQPILAGHECFSIASDSNNNIYSLCEAISQFNSPNFFDTVPVPRTLPEGGNIFITKTDTNYNIKWMKVIESSSSLWDPKMKISPEQNVIITATVFDRIKVDSIDLTFPNHSEPPFVIIQLDSSGNFKWMNLIQNDTYSIEICDIDFDSENNVYVTGTTTSIITFGNLNSLGEFSSSITLELLEGSYSTFFAKYSPDGEFLSAMMIPLIETSNNASYLKIKSMIIDNEDNIYATGWFKGKIHYNSTVIESYGVEIIILKFNKDMELVWSKHFGPGSSTMIQQGNSLAFDKSKKHFYVTGNFIGNKDFGNGIVAANDRNIFLAKYTTDGALKWIKTSGCFSGVASYTEEGQVVYVDNSDFVYLGGEFYGTLYIGDTTLIANNDPNVSNSYSEFFISKYFANGEFSWATSAGSNYSDELGSITKDESNHIFVCGATRSLSFFGEYTLVRPPNASSTIGFLACFNDRVENNQFEESFGIQEQTKSSYKIKIFPNPFINSFEVEIQNDDLSDISIQIVDINGRTVNYSHEKAVNNIQKISYQLINQTPGIYCLLITIGNNIYTYKIVKL